MNRPLVNARLADAEEYPVIKNSVTAKVIPFRTVSNQSADGVLPVVAGVFPLLHFKDGGEGGEQHLLDYLVLGTLAVLLHVAAIDYFQHTRFEQELEVPVNNPPKVEIILSKPKPKPMIQTPPAPPPPPKMLEPPKPKKVGSTPKPVVAKAVPLKPQPKITPVVETVPTPVQPSAPVESKAPPTPEPSPPVVEKVTQPSAGASYLHNPAPEYPEAAMDRGLEGTVLMKVSVQPNGKPDSVTVTKSSGHSVLDAAAVNTVTQWSFVPAMRGKTPIAGWVTVPITFNLQN